MTYNNVEQCGCRVELSRVKSQRNHTRSSIKLLNEFSTASTCYTIWLYIQKLSYTKLVDERSCVGSLVRPFRQRKRKNDGSIGLRVCVSKTKKKKENVSEQQLPLNKQ